MRLTVATLVISACAIASIASAETTPATAQSEAQAPAGSTAKAKYSSSQTQIGILLDSAATKALLEKHFPGLTTNPQIDQARGMTMKDIQPYAADFITDAKLAELDADLVKLAD